MQSEIREAALKLGYTNAVPVTGQPFDVWRKRLSEIPFGSLFSLEHNPAKISGWAVDEITIWVAIAPTPPTTEWLDGCGELSSFYIHSQTQEMRRIAWEKAVIEMGYEIKSDVMLPDRAAAIRGGLGVHGLNGLLITPEHGSFVNITTVLLHAKPPADARGAEFDLSPGCIDCKKCLEACPTGAISDEGVDAVICLRNYMSRQETLPEDDYAKMRRRILGCETCQRACPCNAKLKEEKPPAEMVDCMKLEQLLTEPDIDSISKYVDRFYLKEERLKRQAVLSAANTNRTDLLPLIEALIKSDDKVLGKMAEWAVKQLKQSHRNK